jgi:hypothetical protein
VSGGKWMSKLSKLYGLYLKQAQHRWLGCSF